MSAGPSQGVAKAGLTIVSHNTETGAAGTEMLHFAAATPNFGPDIEWARRAETRRLAIPEP